LAGGVELKLPLPSNRLVSGATRLVEARIETDEIDVKRTWAGFQIEENLFCPGAPAYPRF
jgi:hypothetical protein